MRKNHLLNKDQEVGDLRKSDWLFLMHHFFSGLLSKFHSSDGQKEMKAFGEWGCRGVYNSTVLNIVEGLECHHFLEIWL